MSKSVKMRNKHWKIYKSDLKCLELYLDFSWNLKFYMPLPSPLILWFGPQGFQNVQKNLRNYQWEGLTFAKNNVWCHRTLCVFLLNSLLYMVTTMADLNRFHWESFAWFFWGVSQSFAEFQLYTCKSKDFIQIHLKFGSNDVQSKKLRIDGAIFDFVTLLFCFFFHVFSMFWFQLTFKKGRKFLMF